MTLSEIRPRAALQRRGHAAGGAPRRGQAAQPAQQGRAGAPQPRRIAIPYLRAVKIKRWQQPIAEEVKGIVAVAEGHEPGPEQAAELIAYCWAEVRARYR